MVAITVILAAVIATFVLGLGEQVRQTTPKTSFTFEYESVSPSDCATSSSCGNLTVTHDGGDSIKHTELKLRGRWGSNAGTDGGTGALALDWDEADGLTTTSGEIDGVSAVVAGDFTEIHQIGSDGNVRIIYVAVKGDTSATLTSWEGPDS
jgi:FlaG/FlaF family flagellin (archaellin)